MSTYRPDTWVVLEISMKTDPNTKICKVFGGWYGGFAEGDSWRLNSGITKVEKGEGFTWNFHGNSGSVYEVHQDLYGMSSYQRQQLDSWINNPKAAVDIRILSFDEAVSL